MKQPIKIPPIKDCWCGAKATCIDWDYNMSHHVICDNNHILTKKCGTRNRAIHRWNSRVHDKQVEIVMGKIKEGLVKALENPISQEELKQRMVAQIMTYLDVPEFDVTCEIVGDMLSISYKEREGDK